MERLRAKDRTAFEYLYDHYSGALFGVIHRILKTESIAEEVLQDVFLKIWERIHQYDSTKGKLFTWMVNIARNQAIDKTRSKEISRENKTGSIETIVHTPERGGIVESNVEGIGIKEVLHRLPDELRFIIEHLYFKGYSQAELAEEFNIPLGTVKTRTRSAMSQLRNLLQEH